MKPIKTLALVAALLPFSYFNAAHAVPVSKEVAFVIDVSSSIDSSEFMLQVNGYAAAFKDAEVISAIEALEGGIAAAAFPFAAVGADNPLAPSTFNLDSTPWFHITDAMSAMDFSNALSMIMDGDAAGTNIANGVDAAAAAFVDNGFEGGMQIIDVSTDGVQNLLRDGSECLSPTPTPTPQQILDCLAEFDDAIEASRDDADAAGIMINGLAIFDPEMADDYLSDLVDLLGQETVDMLDLPADLQEYLELHLITDGGFVLTTQFEENQFADAIKQKILNEIQAPPVSMPEPSSIGILMSSLLGMLLYRRKKFS